MENRICRLILKLWNSTTPQHKSFLWHFDFEPFTWHTFYGEQCPSFVTEENKEAWQRYLTKVIKKHLKEEVMNSPEFREIELQIEEKLLRINWDEKRKRSMEKSLLNIINYNYNETETMREVPIGVERILTARLR